ncbi:class I SAM-dependent methyltransferase [Georgenia faecalis]|uniref:class I SAM-dependent methyltransferase n=1 Tax=Georgenia faecalis TaxID=2483799 RepID=UPI000FD86DEE|nr:class I SAM-dependent methyltransferase [Georgenia faecalis]
MTADPTLTYDHPRLAAIYDLDNPDGADHDFFRALADAHNARAVTDLGCGTGILTVTLARAGRTVVGIDPAQAMLDQAVARPGGDGVEWRLGTSERIAPRSADLVLMTGNVAMHILAEAWPRALADVARGLRPGGRLAFESRNPGAEAWRGWTDGPAERDTPAGRLREWTTTAPPDPAGIVTMACRNEFLDTGEVVDVEQRLQFRSLEQLTADLARAGLTVAHVWRDWARTPFTGAASEPLMVVEAVAAPR